VVLHTTDGGSIPSLPTAVRQYKNLLVTSSESKIRWRVLPVEVDDVGDSDVWYVVAVGYRGVSYKHF
jgi:hypothetical protein